MPTDMPNDPEPPAESLPDPPEVVMFRDLLEEVREVSREILKKVRMALRADSGHPRRGPLNQFPLRDRHDISAAHDRAIVACIQARHLRDQAKVIRDES